MWFRRINDTHTGGKAQTHTMEQIYEAVKTSPYPIWFGGDISDIKNCLKHMVSSMVEFIWTLFNMKRSEDIWCPGNHELNRGPDYASNQRFVIRYGGCWSHGDDGFWGYIKAAAFRAKEAGASWFKRFFLIGPIDDLREFAPNPKLNDNVKAFMDSVIDEYGDQVKYFVMGHKHQLAVLEYRGRKLYIFPQGIQDIEIPEAIPEAV